MDGIASVLYGVIAYRTFFGAIFCAVAPSFHKAVQCPNHLLPDNVLHEGGRFVVATTLCILSAMYVEQRDLITLFGDHYSRHLEQAAMLAHRTIVDRPVETWRALED